MHAKMDHFTGYKTNLNKLKRTEVIQSVFTNHSGIKLEINKRKITESLNSWKLNAILNTLWVKEV